MQDEVPFDGHRDKIEPHEVYEPDQPLASVVASDLAFDAQTFAFLASNYMLAGSLKDICQHNAAVRRRGCAH